MSLLQNMHRGANTLLSVDPGIRGCGAALFRAGELVACAYVKNPMKSGSGPAECASMVCAVCICGMLDLVIINVLVVEWPQVYQRGGGRTRGDANDLLGLAGVGGGLAARFWEADTKVRSVSPSEWKGQVPKDAIALRVESRLSEAERVAYDAGVTAVAPSLRHNVSDAVGIGLWGLGRFERRRVISRE